jgi:DNA-binding MarR family transcriptional regulator
VSSILPDERAALARLAGRPQTCLDLARASGWRFTLLANALGRLWEAGLVERGRDAVYTVTDAGRAELARAPRTHAKKEGGE